MARQREAQGEEEQGLAVEHGRGHAVGRAGIIADVRFP
jgi:hypothetical protein